MLYFIDMSIKQSEMLLAGYDMNDLKSKMNKLIDITSSAINRPIHSVIVKIQSGTPFVGKMGGTGSFKPEYDPFVKIPDDLLNELQSIYAKYTRQYPARHTIYFRYNANNDKFECFAAASMVLSSKVA